MKKSNLFQLGAFTAAVLLIGACSNPLFENASAQSGSSPGMGKVLLTLAGQTPRTVTPDLSGIQYTVSFSGGTPSQENRSFSGSSETFFLPPGIWTLTVTGKIGATEVSRGTRQNVAITADEITSIPIAMFPSFGSGNGTLQLNIKYNDALIDQFTALNTATVEITGLSPTETLISNNLLLASTLRIQSKSAGAYLLKVKLVDSGGKQAVKSEVVHIYAGKTTVIDWNFTSALFAMPKTISLASSPIPAATGTLVFPIDPNDPNGAVDNNYPASSFDPNDSANLGVAVYGRGQVELTFTAATGVTNPGDMKNYIVITAPAGSTDTPAIIDCDGSNDPTFILTVDGMTKAGTYSVTVLSFGEYEVFLSQYTLDYAVPVNPATTHTDITDITGIVPATWLLDDPCPLPNIQSYAGATSAPQINPINATNLHEARWEYVPQSGTGFGTASVTGSPTAGFTLTGTAPGKVTVRLTIPNQTFTEDYTIDIVDETSPDLKTKFGISTAGAAGVTDTFNAIHDYLQTPRTIRNDRTETMRIGKIGLGDYIDLPPITIASGSTVQQPRVIVVGINSFASESAQHLVFQFKDILIFQQNMGSSYISYGDENGGTHNNMRIYLNDTTDFLTKLTTAGVPDSLLFAPERNIGKTSGIDTLNNTHTDVKVWIPTQGEMFGTYVAADNTTPTGESASNQARFYYYHNDTSRIKKDMDANGTPAQSYWLATSDDTAGSETFATVDATGVLSSESFSDTNTGVAPAFCIK
ncbi:MAG: DUF6273 domain-containing protein [Spirochaetaceae bacterium]|jgi:hypothetical protein|nr:DUF6273 domain-containing protein [Spirochaetaceae bacterium]